MRSKILQKLPKACTKTKSRIKIFVKPYSISKSEKRAANIGVWVWGLAAFTDSWVGMRRVMPDWAIHRVEQ